MAHWRSTPSHGYLVLCAKEYAALPQAVRTQHENDGCTRGTYDFEEDCQWSIPVALMPEIMLAPSQAWLKDMTAGPDKILDDARRVLRTYYPELAALLEPEPTPAPLMVPGPGAPQYTFDVPPDQQLALL